MTTYFGMLALGVALSALMAPKEAIVRQPEYEIADIFVQRRAPRALSDKMISKKELLKLIEAARWAPSAFNNQPWRFIYAKRGSQAWQTMFDLMVPFNQHWAKPAPYLVMIISKNTHDRNQQPLDTDSFDTGAAWQNMCLQAEMNGLTVRGISGFDYQRAYKELNIPAGYKVEIMCTIARPGKKDTLPIYMQAKEIPTLRKKVDEIAFEGVFRG